MIRMLISFGIRLLANAVGLIVANLVLDDMELNASGFIIAVLIFTVAQVILQPLIVKIALTHANALIGATALVTTLVGLIITDLVSDGLSITGFVTWCLATVIVWAAALVAGLILPLILVKKAVDNNNAANPNTTTFG
jgi:hypothetical protein